MKKRDLKEYLTAWGLLSPALIVLVAFGLFPIVYAFFVSLHKWRIKQGPLIGFEHYVRALGDPQWLAVLACGIILWVATRRLVRARDEAAWAAPVRWGGLLLACGLLVWAVAGMWASGDGRLFNGFRVTLFYALGTIPVELAVSLGLAYLLTQSMRGKGGFRLVFFLPYITPAIASAVVFRTLFSPHPSSLANRFWGIFGFEDQRWLFENKSVLALVCQAVGWTEYPAWIDGFFPSLALVSIILYNIWVYIGYDTVILLAGLTAIPRHYYEAAAIDGANPWQVFRHITLPLISPTLFFLSMVAVIGTFKAFNHIYIMRTPGARDTVDVLSVVIFDQIFQFHNAGYASTLAFILFIAILGLTLLQNRILGRRVFYGD